MKISIIQSAKKKQTYAIEMKRKWHHMVTNEVSVQEMEMGVKGKLKSIPLNCKERFGIKLR